MEQYNKKIRSSLVIVAILAVFLSISLLPIARSDTVIGEPPPEATITLSYNQWDRIHYEVTAVGFILSIDLLVNGAVIDTVEIEMNHPEWRIYTGDFTLNIFAFFVEDVRVQVAQKYEVEVGHWEFINYVSDKITILSPIYLIILIAGSIVAVVSIAFIYRARHGEVRQITKRLLSELEKLK